MFTVADDDVTLQRNVTSLVNRALTLQCPLAERSRARTTWQKRDDDGNWRLLPRDSGRIRVGPRDTAELEFYRLLVSDAGFYRCSKTTMRGIENHSAPVALIVHGMTTFIIPDILVVCDCVSVGMYVCL